MKLKTETNTPAMRERIEAAFDASDRGAGNLGPDDTAHAVFEHDQWWITCPESGVQWSVCDAVGGDAIDGFTFEQVSEGES